MSGVELLAVVACVAAVCSAYHDGAEILQQIKAKRKARKAARQDLLTENSTQELELSLVGLFQGCNYHLCLGLFAKTRHISQRVPEDGDADFET